jgi:hypothetical protein
MIITRRGHPVACSRVGGTLADLSAKVKKFWGSLVTTDRQTTGSIRRGEGEKFLVVHEYATVVLP